MNKYKYGDWYCRPANEEEAEEIIKHALASGAELYESVGPKSYKTQYHWDFCSAWGVLSGKTFTSDAESPGTSFVDAQELTIEEVRERFPLPNRVDWSKAPHDAQFFSYGGFRKHEDGSEYKWCKDRWADVHYDSPEWHKKQSDFELKPKAVSTEWNGEGCPPAGIHVEVLHNGVWIKATTVGKFSVYTVCAPSGGGFYGYEPSEMRPLRTNRDKWIEEASQYTADTVQGTLETIYDAMVLGNLKLPEIGSAQQPV